MAKDKERESTRRKSGGETVAIKAREAKEAKGKALSKGKSSASIRIDRAPQKCRAIWEGSELTVPGGVQAGLHEPMTGSPTERSPIQSGCAGISHP